MSEVHVSCVFSWDLGWARQLCRAWDAVYPGKVSLGGPALGSPVNTFTPGLYVRRGVVFTSRGCYRRCAFCLVPWREGPLVQYESIAWGHIIADNNFLQCTRAHRHKVYGMLGFQRRGADFRGGIDARLVTDDIAAEFRDLRIHAVWLAADDTEALRPLERAVKHLAWLGREKLRCYVLIGHGDETPEQAERRLRAVYEIGCLPQAMIYRGPDEMTRRRSSEWSALAKMSRPAAMKSVMRSLPREPAAVLF